MKRRLWIVTALLLVCLGACQGPGSGRQEKEITDTASAVTMTQKGTEALPSESAVSQTVPASFAPESTPSQAESGNTLFDDVSPWGSFSLGIFDGKEYSCCMNNPDWRRDLYVLQTVKAEKADDFSLDKVTFPLYEIEAAEKSYGSTGLRLLWTNGYLITRTGDIYHFDYDFAQLAERDWHIRETGAGGISRIRNSRFLAQQGDEWIFSYMSEAEPFSPSVKAALEVKKKEAGGLELLITSRTEETLMYGEEYWIEVTDREKWFRVPTDPEHSWGFSLVGYFLSPGETAVQEPYLDMYGTLPPGHYRIVKRIGAADERIAAEFDLP